MSSKKAVNAGVHAITGFELQKHFALYILLEEWNNLKEKKFFICLEHHDDFLFCYQTETGLISKINSYQSKKSSDKWGMSKVFFDILRKIIDVGEDLHNDSIAKDTNFSQSLYLISNNTMKISIKRDSKTIEENINEANKQVLFINLDTDLQDKLCEEINKLDPPRSSMELKNLVLRYIDFSKGTKEQQHQLVGMFEDVFGDSVDNYKAAVLTLMSLFRDIETMFNEGHKAKLLDESKRVNSSEIKEAINIITTQSKAYELWRAKKSEVARILSISVAKHKEFELHFENSFDYFKDMEQVEHQKVFNFVQDNKNLLDECMDDCECIKLIYEKITARINISQAELYIKAAIFAAYIEIKEMQ